jgi:filamentous hemagglutinin
VENNFFGKVLVEGCAIAALCRTKVAEQLLEIGVKASITAVVAKEIADNLSSEELEHVVRLYMMGNDEITVKYLNSLQDKYGSENASNPNLGKELTNEQKAELGGAGSETGIHLRQKMILNSRMINLFKNSIRSRKVLLRRSII